MLINRFGIGNAQTGEFDDLLVAFASNQGDVVAQGSK
jgi:hypothetical protein